MRMLPIMRSYTSVRRAVTIGAMLFTTAASSSAAAGNGDIVLHAKRATVVQGAWSAVNDPTAAGGTRLANPDAGLPRSPPRRPRRRLLRADVHGRSGPRVSPLDPQQGAERLVDERFGLRAVQRQRDRGRRREVPHRDDLGAMYSLEEDSNMGESGWGWQDNGYGLNVLGEDSTSPARRRPSACSRARTASRSIKSCCRR